MAEVDQEGTSLAAAPGRPGCRLLLLEKMLGSTCATQQSQGGASSQGQPTALLKATTGGRRMVCVTLTAQALELLNQGPHARCNTERHEQALQWRETEARPLSLCRAASPATRNPLQSLPKELWA